MTAVSRSKLQQICYFKTVSPKPVLPNYRAISLAHDNVLFQYGQCSSTEIARVKVSKLSQWFNKLFNGAMASNVMPSCRPGLGLVNTIFAESWG